MTVQPRYDKGRQFEIVRGGAKLQFRVMDAANAWHYETEELPTGAIVVVTGRAYSGGSDGIEVTMMARVVNGVVGRSGEFEPNSWGTPMFEWLQPRD